MPQPYAALPPWAGGPIGLVHHQYRSLTTWKSVKATARLQVRALGGRGLGPAAEKPAPKHKGGRFFGRSPASAKAALRPGQAGWGYRVK